LMFALLSVILGWAGVVTLGLNRFGESSALFLCLPLSD
jgi:hypothetical protein